MSTGEKKLAASDGHGYYNIVQKSSLRTSIASKSATTRRVPRELISFTGKLPLEKFHELPSIVRCQPGRSVIIITIMIRTGPVRGERANFTRLVLGRIEATFCK